jgi:hypothetical protein
MEWAFVISSRANLTGHRGNRTLRNISFLVALMWNEIESENDQIMWGLEKTEILWQCNGVPNVKRFRLVSGKLRLITLAFTP